MPGFDRSGPFGKGERTGRGEGRCSEKLKNFNEKDEFSEIPEDLKRFPRRMKGNAGRRRNRRWRFSS